MGRGQATDASPIPWNSHMFAGSRDRLLPARNLAGQNHDPRVKALKHYIEATTLELRGDLVGPDN